MAKRGHKIAAAEAVNFAIGVAQFFWRTGEEGYIAASDHRKDGGTVGF